MARFDLLVKNARIVDGTGAPWYRGEVAVKDGKIAYIGAPGEIAPADASKVVDAGDKVVSPGFIDIHAHSDFLLLRDPADLGKLRQGVTTEIVGQCGLTPAPVSEEYKDLLNQYTSFLHAGAELDWSWRSLGDYLKRVEDARLGINVGFCVGHGSIRLAVMGFSSAKAGPEELAKMQALTREAMEDGAFGVSSGLIYPPGMYSDTEELIEVCRAAAPYGAVYLTHMRNESDHLLEAVKEAIRIGEEAGIPVQIVHHKACGRQNWGLVKESLRLIEEARARGLDITVDQYPYIATSTTLSAVLPPWAQVGGVEALCARLDDAKERARMREDIEHGSGWENQIVSCGGLDGILVIYAPATPEVQGKTVAAAAKERGVDPLEFAFDVIKANRGAATACYFALCEDDVKYVMRHPLVMVGSDGIPTPPSAQPHPRMNGTFPRVLGHYSREEKVMPLEEAVRKMTSFPAARLKLTSKGQIAVGKDADLVIFDPATIIDRATYTDSQLPPAGIDYVFVNGVKVIDHGEYTGERPGRLLRRQTR